MKNAPEQEIYKPVVLNSLVQAIYELCQKHSHVAFNAPPDFQSEFVQYIKSLEDTDVGFKYRNRIFFENRPLINYLKKINPGDMFLAFVLDNKLGGLAIVGKVESILKANEIPANWRVDIHETKTYRRYFGEGGMWTGCIVAMTRIKCLKREMCWPDPEAKIFMAKAAKHGVE